MDFAGKIVGAKIFVEEMISSIDGGTSPTTYCTGRLQEVRGFSNVSYSNSAGLDKSFSVTLRNPGNILTASIVKERGVNRPAPSQADVDHNQVYAKTLYNKGARSFNPFDASTDDPNSKYVGVALHSELVYGVAEDAPNLTTMSHQPPFSLGEMQRIWVILKTEFDSGRDPKYTLIAGIITGFNEGHDVNGETTFTISCSGISRLLELTRVHTKQFYGALYKTQAERFAELVLRPVLDLLSSSLGGGYLAAHGPIASMLYAAWLTNATFSWFGRIGNYSIGDLDSAALSGAGTYPGMFMQLPPWRLSSGIPKAPEQIKNSLQSLGGSDIDSEACKAWGQKLSMVFGRTSAKNFMSSRSEMFGGRETRELYARILYEGGLLGGRVVTASDLLPSVYYDDLLKKLYLDGDGDLQLFEKRIAASFELFTINAMTAREIMDKMAQAALGIIREDDQGNLIFELARYWEAPAQTADDYSHVNIAEYAKWPLYPSQITKDKDGPDYIVDGSNFKSRNLSSSEANVVTHVETPCSVQFFEQSEVMRNLTATGYSGQTDRDPSRVAYIEYLERRYGYRPFTVPPINSNGTTFGDDNRNGVRLKVAMDIFADAMLDFRNYARHQCSFNVDYAPWLDCGRNVFLMGRGELWMINNKTVIYSISESGGDASTSLSCSHGHYLTERVGYPYLDAIIRSETVQKYADAVAADYDLALQEEAATNASRQSDIPAPDSYDDIIKAAAGYFGVPWDLAKGLFLHESGMVPNAESGTGAKGIAQLFSPAVQDVKNRWPNTIGLSMDVPEDNIWLGAGYLKICLGDCEDNVYFGLFSYNRGRGTGRGAYKSAKSQYGRAPNRQESLLWLKKYPPDKYGNPSGDGYVAAVNRQFATVSSPQRDAWNAISTQPWPSEEAAVESFPWEES